MNYWEEVKRIQVKMRSASIWTAEASEIIDRITEKHGYYFRVNSIFRAVPIEEIRQMIAEAKKSGGNEAEIAAVEEVYKDAGSFVIGDKLEEAEVTERQAELEKIVRRLEVEVDEYLQAHKTKED